MAFSMELKREYLGLVVGIGFELEILAQVLTVFLNVLNRLGLESQLSYQELEFEKE